MTDQQIKRIVSQFRKGILDGNPPDRMCFAVCSPLSGHLSFAGIENELIRGVLWGAQGQEHFWLKLPDGRIIDPTASQFKTPEGKNMPPVYFGEKPEWYKTPLINDKKAKRIRKKIKP